jgi:hypothetical protein
VLDTVIVVVVEGLYLMVLVLAVLSLLALPVLVVTSLLSRGDRRRPWRRG